MLQSAQGAMFFKPLTRLWPNCIAFSGSCRPLLIAAFYDTPSSDLLACRFETSCELSRCLLVAFLICWVRNHGVNGVFDFAVAVLAVGYHSEFRRTARARGFLTSARCRTL
jgi:hypothetical protein